jgi:hypothetical protein
MPETAQARDGGQGGILELQIVGLHELESVIPLQHGLGLVVDAMNDAELPVTTLARLARLRRVLCGIGGNLVLAADDDTIASLRRTGLGFALPCRRGVPRAVQLIVGWSVRYQDRPLREGWHVNRPNSSGSWLGGSA